MLRRDETPLLDDDTRLHLRDVSDHTAQLTELLDSYRETAAGLIDMHLSLANYQMNDVMRVLTVVGSVFIPLTFITGIYGMNFDPAASPWNMPELGARYGYPGALAIMLLVTVALLIFFRRRGWLGAARRR
jgi:magnesium transporter